MNNQSVTERVTSTLNTLANANELVRTVTAEIIGNELADTINGSPLGRDTIYQLAQATFINHLNKGTVN